MPVRVGIAAAKKWHLCVNIGSKMERRVVFLAWTEAGSRSRPRDAVMARRACAVLLGFGVDIEGDV